MVKPSQIARKARREHERQQELLRQQHQPICQGCIHYTATKAREARNVAGNHKCEKPIRSHVREGLRNKFFIGTIIISPKHEALAEVIDEFGYCSNRLVYWTDGSRFPTSCGIGIAYSQSPNTWSQLSWRLRKYVGSYALEVFAIARAIDIAWEQCRDAQKPPRSVCIYSDSTTALRHFARFRRSLDKLKKTPLGDVLIGPGIIASERLNALGVGVELRWVPGHAGIEGNVKADQAAKKGANHAVRRGRLMTAL